MNSPTTLPFLLLSLIIKGRQGRNVDYADHNSTVGIVKETMMITPDTSQSLDLHALVARYREALQRKNYTAQTVRSFTTRLGYFIAWCNEHSITSALEITTQLLERYRSYLQRYRTKSGKPLALETQRSYLATVRRFFRYLVKHHHIFYDPGAAVALPKPAKRLPRNIFSRSEVEQVIHYPDTTRPLGIRDRAMLETLYSTGVRRSELVALSVDDLDLQRGILTVVQGKGRKDRVIPIGKRACRWIEKYLIEVRPHHVKSQQNALFLTSYGKPFSTGGVGPHIAALIKGAGIDKPGACHIFRHTMATHMLENGADLRYIQEMLGHTSLSSTQIYTKVACAELKQAHKRSHPASRPIELDVSRRHYHNRDLLPDAQRPRFIKPSPGRDFWEQTATPGTLLHLGQRHFADLTAQGYSAKTIAERRLRLRKFLLWCKERDITTPNEVSRNIIEYYQQHLHRLRKKGTDQPYSPGYRMLHLNTIAQFFSYLLQHHHILHDPTIVIDRPKVPKHLPHHIPTVAEVDHIMHQPDTTKAIGIRDRAILETLYSTGMRRSELIHLKPRHLDHSDQTVLIIEGKGNKDRKIPIGQRALTWIEKYQGQVRPRLHPTPDAPLFLTQHGYPLTPRTLSTTISSYIKAAAINKTGSCHILRHSMASHMLENGANVRHIQEILGHASLDNTQIYTKVAIQKLKQVHNQTHPAETTKPL